MDKEAPVMILPHPALLPVLRRRPQNLPPAHCPQRYLLLITDHQLLLTARQINKICYMLGLCLRAKERYFPIRDHHQQHFPVPQQEQLFNKIPYP